MSVLKIKDSKGNWQSVPYIEPDIIDDEASSTELDKTYSAKKITEMVNEGGGGTTVSYTATLTEGKEIGTLTIDGADNILYAPNSVEVDAYTKEETDNLLAEKSKVTVTPTLTEGYEIGKVNVDGVDNTLYAPNDTGIAFSETEPTEESVVLWIDPNEDIPSSEDLVKEILAEIPNGNEVTY